MEITTYLLCLFVLSIVAFIKLYAGKAKTNTNALRSRDRESSDDSESVVVAKQGATPSTLRQRIKHHIGEREIEASGTQQVISESDIVEKHTSVDTDHSDSRNSIANDENASTLANRAGESNNNEEHQSEDVGKDGNEDEGEDEDEGGDEGETEDEDEEDNENEDKDLHEVVESKVFETMHAACVSLQGKRPKNEDRMVLKTIAGVHFCGIFDGHDGCKASEYCANHLIKNITSQKDFTTAIPKAILSGFCKTDKRFVDKMESGGSTAILAILDNPKKILHIANVGDSRCVVSIEGKAVALSTDHKPNLPDEAERINKTSHDVQITTEIVLGQRVKIARIDGMLAVSRAIGDGDFKDSPDKPAEEQAVSPVPDITTVELSLKHEFLVLACDGLWDVLSNQEVVDFIKSRLEKPISESKLLEIAKSLASFAIQEKHSTDNVTVLILVF